MCVGGASLLGESRGMVPTRKKFDYTRVFRAVWWHLETFGTLFLPLERKFFRCGVVAQC